MKNTLIALGLASIAATALPSAASAAPWQSIDARQDRLYSRIEQGVRSGQLTRPEAANLRNRFVRLAALERNYRRDGLSFREREDLNRRFDALSASIYGQKHDRQRRGW